MEYNENNQKSVYDSYEALTKAGSLKNKKKSKKPNLVKSFNKPVEKLEYFVSKKGENVTPSYTEDVIRKVLNGYSFDFLTEVSFKGLVGKANVPYRFDFYIPSLNLIIEYDGQTHNDKNCQIRDKRKNRFCKKQNIRLYRFNKEHYHNLETEVIKVIAKYYKM